MFIIIVAIAVWVAVIGVYWFLTSTLKSQDVDRMKSRLLGGSKKKQKSKSDSPQAALLANTQPEKGQLLLRLMVRYKLVDRVQTMIDQSGLKWDVSKFAQITVAAFLAAFVALWYWLPSGYQSLAFVFLGSMIAACIPTLTLIRKRSARMRRFEEQFPESLEFVSRSMRAGHAFSVSLEMIHKEFQEPLAGEFRRAFEEHNLGLPLDVALEKLSQRVPLLDVHFFVSAVLLQKRTGGNLAEILDKLAFIIRERFKLRGKIRAISAHGRMTGMALTSIPIGVGVLMFYTNPDYVKFFFTDDVGNIMLGATVFFELVGYAIISKIVKIEV